MRYKVGDIVLIRSWKSMKDEYGLTPALCIPIRGSFIPFMRKYCNTMAEIACVGESNFYSLRSIEYSYTEEMFVNKLIKRRIL